MLSRCRLVTIRVRVLEIRFFMMRLLMVRYDEVVRLLFVMSVGVGVVVGVRVIEGFVNSVLVEMYGVNIMLVVKCVVEAAMSRMVRRQM